MRSTWRWFGPADAISIAEVRQTEAQGIVTALHHVPIGDVWTEEQIRQRQAEIAMLPDGTPSGMAWEVVESLPVSEDIKRQTGKWRSHIAAYIDSMENLARCGLEVICYNFMPLIDWTRTDLASPVSTGGNCMRFDYVDFACFDVHVLARSGAEQEYSESVIAEAARRHAAMNDRQRVALVGNIIAGLPGTDASYSLGDLRAELGVYARISEANMRANYTDFLEQIVPVAERLGLRLCCHPDDPPFALLGLPRIMSTEEDYALMGKAVDSCANGITLCSGSLGARADNDVAGMMERLGDRVHFIHLRNVLRESAEHGKSFHEAAHLDGSTDMPAVIAAILKEEDKRVAAGRADRQIPYRPDHGQAILDDLSRKVQPGYPLLGRMKGLAEIRGSIAAIRSLGLSS